MRTGLDDVVGGHAGMAPNNAADIELKLLMEAIFLRYGHDFRDYAISSQRRRVDYALPRLGCRTISQLQQRVLREPGTFAQLLQCLTIPVTQMFRDPGFFVVLRNEVMPILRTYPSLKIWIAGCSTGEEVYSLAILLHEEGLLARSIIYATDINPVSLETARRAVYPDGLMQRYAQSYLQAGGTRNFSDYYVSAYGAARFDRLLSERVTFADHSLATDSVFSEMHLICCRNVLIYFNKSLQDRALRLFHESLCHRGFLGLGSKETTGFGGVSTRFDVLSKQERLYRKS